MPLLYIKCTMKTLTIHKENTVGIDEKITQTYTDCCKSVSVIRVFILFFLIFQFQFQCTWISISRMTRSYFLLYFRHIFYCFSLITSLEVCIWLHGIFYQELPLSFINKNKYYFCINRKSSYFPHFAIFVGFYVLHNNLFIFA